MIDINSLLDKLQAIYKKKIKRKQKEILVEDSKYLDQDDSRMIISTGFDIYIFLNLLKENLPENHIFSFFDMEVKFNKKEYKILKEEYLEDIKKKIPNSGQLKSK